MLHKTCQARSHYVLYNSTRFNNVLDKLSDFFFRPILAVASDREHEAYITNLLFKTVELVYANTVLLQESVYE